MELYSKVRMSVLRDGVSQRETALSFGIDRGRVSKMVSHAAPPVYRQAGARVRPKLGAHAGFIDDILKSDLTAPKKQRHTILRIFERLRDGRGFDGGYTTVRDYVRPRRLSLKEVFVPLVHPAGEPIITIGALARLVDEHHWPLSQIGLQSKGHGAFDLIGYRSDHETEVLACEVKKSAREVDRLVDAMRTFASTPSLDSEPSGTERNAYRKLEGLRRSWPQIVWALGPGGVGTVFEVKRTGGAENFDLIKVNHEKLNWILGAP